ncbi:MAG: phage major capsid protein, partial [Selenomonadaceae bacterium]|nr:phage major capsid protein [Selenomonadaceae bacterium]
ESKPDERTAAVNNEVPENQTEKRNAPSYMPGAGFKTAGESRSNFDKIIESREQAGKDLKELRTVQSDLSPLAEVRAVTVGSGTTIVLPKYDSTDIKPDFNIVSSLIDNVQHFSFPNGESFNQPYIKGVALGGYTGEGNNATDAETQFDYAEITKSKVTAYCEITEELENLPAAPYADTVFTNIRTSMRALITRQILVGGGNSNQLTGIFSAKATAIDSDTDLAITTIDDKTLNEIVYNYGGDEEVEDAAVLILSKLDLLAFANVRTNNKQAFYDIKAHGNYGTINGINYIINSACNPISSADTTAGDYCMAYGSLSNYMLVDFSPLKVEKSIDFKFMQGMTAFRGVEFLGGNVVRKNGFLRITKKATTL